MEVVTKGRVFGVSVGSTGTTISAWIDYPAEINEKFMGLS